MDASASNVTNPLFECGDALERMEGEAFREYLMKRTADHNVVEVVIEEHGTTTGAGWMELLTCLGEDATVRMLHEECGITSMMRIMKLLTDARKAQQRVKDHENWTTGREDTRRQAAEGKVDTAGKGGRDKEDDRSGLDVVKLGDMPTFAKPQAGEKMITSMQLHRLKVALSTFFGQHSQALSKGMVAVIENYEVDLDVYLQALDQREIMFDGRAAGRRQEETPRTRVCTQDDTVCIDASQLQVGRADSQDAARVSRHTCLPGPKGTVLEHRRVQGGARSVQQYHYARQQDALQDSGQTHAVDTVLQARTQ